jgi:TRAP-type C4-dicarboxylate transport system permease large subunit
MVLYIVIIGANTFSYFVTAGQVPEALIGLIGGLHLAPLAVIGMFLLAYLVLGMMFDEASAIVITLPIVLPVVVSLGYDPIWWGVINVILVEIAIIHPPFGVIVFVIHGLRPDIPMARIYRGVLPFLVADFVVIFLLIAFPQLALWLPKLLTH